MVPGAVIKTEADVDQAVKEIGLPMIAKPDNGVGAAATFKLETKTISITSSKNGTIQPFIYLKNLSLPAKSVPLTGSWTRMERLSSQQPLTTPIHRLTS